jgi:Rrf2 family iron-sulfur cluster assembly transcriptional regulator
MAMVEMAARQCAEGSAASLATNIGGCRGRPVSLAEIAGAQQLSLAYLEQLFGRLRRAGLVASARGPGGGYRLARAAESIAVAEIICAVDEPIRATRCEEGTPGCLNGGKCLTHDLWSELGTQIHLFLAGMTLADIVSGRVRGRAAKPLAPGATQAAK